MSFMMVKGILDCLLSLVSSQHEVSISEIEGESKIICEQLKKWQIVHGWFELFYWEILGMGRWFIDEFFWLQYLFRNSFAKTIAPFDLLCLFGDLELKLFCF